MFPYPKVYTVESVTCGHPDKVCDQISDAAVDACLAEDPKSRVAVEAFGGHNMLMVGGEVTSRAKVDYEALARKVYKDIGYSDKDLKIIVNVVTQSPDIAMGVDTGGAGDQGIMYGYATDETPEFLPKGLVLAHALAKNLEKLRRGGGPQGKLEWLRPDGKTQVTFEDGRVRTVLVSTQHAEGVPQETIRAALIEKLIGPTLEENGLDGVKDIEVLVNPTGNFVQGGFDADTGLTGRKIMVDTYGGLAPHGGGCFSGKDPTKVDRSAAYMCRFVAKNLVAKGMGKRALVSVSYAIGRAEPTMVHAITDTEKDVSDYVMKNFDFRPRAIIERLGLQRPIYFQTAAYGHFGKKGLPWEEIVP